MRSLPSSFNHADRTRLETMVAFLRGRLQEKETIGWALAPGPDEDLKRWAILQLLAGKEGVGLREPWRSAWRLIEEFWDHSIDHHSLPLGKYQVQERLHSGERSGALVSAIVDLVAPRLSIEPYSARHLELLKLPKTPRKAPDLFDIKLTSGETIGAKFLGLKQIDDAEFMVSLANALDAAVQRGLDVARRIGWNRVEFYLSRVYFTSNSEQGLAPSVQLLQAVVSRLVDVDCTAARVLVWRWKRTDSAIHLRLWAAMARDSRIASAREAGDLLLDLNSSVFWDVHHHPEVTELRALRFAELDDPAQQAIARRIRRGPSRSSWPPEVEPDRFEEDRDYWIVRELKRLEVAKADLPSKDKAWLDANLGRFEDLSGMSRIDEGFLGFVGPGQVRRVSLISDRSLDSLRGTDRLKALEKALSSRHREWNSPERRALNWLRDGDNLEKVLPDLESTPDGGAGFPNVWRHFGREHSPAGTGEDTRRKLAERAIALLGKVTPETLSSAIEGVAHWLHVWREDVVCLPEWSMIWKRAWPCAVEHTNEMEEVHGAGPIEPDALDTPSAKLVGLFLEACPNLDETPRPFDNPVLREVRTKVITPPGPSGLIAKQQLIESLGYFHRADQEWTKKHLVDPLREEDAGCLTLWRRIRPGRLGGDVLSIIGGYMVDRARDLRLDRETRCTLASIVLVEFLDSLREGREPAVDRAPVQQMIRSVTEEERESCAETVAWFVREAWKPSEENPDPPSPEDLFLSAAKPFLEQVWPQELSLTTKGISSSLAKLPAASGGEFVQAVATVERFLVPFDCWMMLDFGLYSGDDDDGPSLSMIEDEEKARALLRLLDLTVGTAEDAVIPFGLGEALDRVREVAPRLRTTPEYRRLDTVARRAGR